MNCGKFYLSSEARTFCENKVLLGQLSASDIKSLIQIVESPISSRDHEGICKSTMLKLMKHILEDFWSPANFIQMTPRGWEEYYLEKQHKWMKKINQIASDDTVGRNKEQDLISTKATIGDTRALDKEGQINNFSLDDRAETRSLSDLYQNIKRGGLLDTSSHIHKLKVTGPNLAEQMTRSQNQPAYYNNQAHTLERTEKLVNSQLKSPEAKDDARKPRLGLNSLFFRKKPNRSFSQLANGKIPQPLHSAPSLTLDQQTKDEKYKRQSCSPPESKTPEFKGNKSHSLSKPESGRLPQPGYTAPLFEKLNDSANARRNSKFTPLIPYSNKKLELKREEAERSRQIDRDETQSLSEMTETVTRRPGHCKTDQNINLHKGQSCSPEHSKAKNRLPFNRMQSKSFSHLTRLRDSSPKTTMPGPTPPRDKKLELKKVATMKASMIDRAETCSLSELQVTEPTWTCHSPEPASRRTPISKEGGLYSYCTLPGARKKGKTIEVKSLEVEENKPIFKRRVVTRGPSLTVILRNKR